MTSWRRICFYRPLVGSGLSSHARAAPTSLSHLSTRCHSNTNIDIAIIGGGAVGLHVAYQLLQRDNRLCVKLFESSNSAIGQSINFCNRLLGTYHDQLEMAQLASDGIASYRNWSSYLSTESSKLSASFVETGLLYLHCVPASQGNLLADRYEAFLNVPYTLLHDNTLTARWDGSIRSDAASAPETSHAPPESDPSAEPLCHLLDETAGFVDAARATQDVLNCLNEKYATQFSCELETQVTDVLYRNYHLTGVRTQRSGSSSDLNSVDWPCGIVINCSGAWWHGMMGGKVANVGDIVQSKFDIDTVHVAGVTCGAREMFEDGKSPIPIVSDGLSGCYICPDATEKRVFVSGVGMDANASNVEKTLLSVMKSRLNGVFDTDEKVMRFVDVCETNEQDRHPLIGSTNLEGLLVCAGFGVNAFKCAPAAASMIANAVTGIGVAGDSLVMMDVFSPYRKAIPVKRTKVNRQGCALDL